MYVNMYSPTSLVILSHSLKSFSAIWMRCLAMSSLVADRYKPICSMQVVIVCVCMCVYVCGYVCVCACACECECV